MPPKPSPPCARCGKRGATVPPLCGKCRQADKGKAERAERRRLPASPGRRVRTEDEQAAADEKVRLWKHMTEEERREAVRQALR